MLLFWRLEREGAWLDDESFGLPVEGSKNDEASKGTLRLSIFSKCTESKKRERGETSEKGNVQTTETGEGAWLSWAFR